MSVASTFHDEMPIDITAERIVALMFRYGYSVTTLAEAIGKGRSALSLKMNGHTRWFMEELVDVARELNTTVGYLLGETDDDRRPGHLKGDKKTPGPLDQEQKKSDDEGLDPATSRL